ncbi:Putative acetate transporter GPR1/Ato2/SatP [Colletotrichum destructivum]|uniref:Acetate transporter GPR1/Ato2/SatP n=1 Tax=Colletotrichum destructivum TaxID=34406 RepID=A0AAX4I854_9PEZI|nr:Putative acetate transporter GPR1/Ato2/SatP [Colletotrichum destructivum]
MSAYSPAQNGASEKGIESVRPETTLERSETVQINGARFPAPRPLPTAATSLPIGAFATTLTTLSLSLMEWRGVTTTNVYIANFFFLAAFGLLISAQWELTAGNGFGYSVFSAFGMLARRRRGSSLGFTWLIVTYTRTPGLFYAGYGAILTPSFGVAAAYGDDIQQYNNALGLFMIIWSVFVLAYLVASLPTNVVYILIFVFVELAFVAVAASYFAAADGKQAASTGLKKAGGAFAFLAGLVGWYLTFHLLLKDSVVELPLGDTSQYFPKTRKRQE